MSSGSTPYLEKQVRISMNEESHFSASLPPAYVVRREGNVLTRVCPSVCPQGGGSVQGGQSGREGGGGVSPAGGGQSGRGGSVSRGGVSQDRTTE